MAMLHPRFNHLGRSDKKKVTPTKARLKAQAEHTRFLAKFGISPKPPRRLSGAVPLDNAAHNHRNPNLPPLSNTVGNGFRHSAPQYHEAEE